MQARQILIALAIKHQGDWMKIYKDIQDRNSEGLEEIDTNIDAITRVDKDYPEELKKIHQPPFVLFYKGNKELLKRKIVAVCGSRETTEGQIARTKKIVNKLNENDYAVINGLTAGIGHTALETAKNKIAVLGFGIDACYPNSEKKLKEEIEKSGLIISEYPQDVYPATENFMARQRIVAGLCDKMAIISAEKQSATIAGVSLALCNAKDIYCVPDLDNDESECNKLINEGAFMLITGNELLG